MSVKINKLPGIKLKEDEMYSLIGLVEDRPQAKYDFAAGTTISKFLIGLKEGKLLGRKCPKCGRIFVPPRSYCEWCHVATSEWVEVPQTGQIHTATITYISSKREKIAKPLVVGTIKLDVPGYRDDEYEFAGLFHKICIDPEDVINGKAIGMKVKVKWKPKEQRTGSVLDIECFEPY